MTDPERWLEELFYRDIAPVRALALRVRECTPARVRLEAPLAPNMNDKGTAFAGSMASLMTLAGWGLVRCRLERAGVACDIVIHRGEVCYRAPVMAEFAAVAEWDAEQNARFEACLQSRGRSRILVPIRVESEGKTRATLEARYVAIRREEA